MRIGFLLTDLKVTRISSFFAFDLLTIINFFSSFDDLQVEKSVSSYKNIVSDKRQRVAKSSQGDDLLLHLQMLLSV